LNYSREVYHIGPTAQDFFKAFGLGSKDTNYKAVDVAGIALAGIKAQQEEIEELKYENDLMKFTLCDMGRNEWC